MGPIDGFTTTGGIKEGVLIANFCLCGQFGGVLSARLFAEALPHTMTGTIFQHVKLCAFCYSKFLSLPLITSEAASEPRYKIIQGQDDVIWLLLSSRALIHTAAAVLLRNHSSETQHLSNFPHLFECRLVHVQPSC